MSHIRISQTHTFSQKEAQSVSGKIADFLSAKHKLSVMTCHNGLAMSGDGIEGFSEVLENQIILTFNIGFASQDYINQFENDIVHSLELYAGRENTVYDNGENIQLTPIDVSKFIGEDGQQKESFIQGTKPHHP